jgi:hypothetical protein
MLRRAFVTVTMRIVRRSAASSFAVVVQSLLLVSGRFTTTLGLNFAVFSQWKAQANYFRSGSRDNPARDYPQLLNC